MSKPIVDFTEHMKDLANKLVVDMDWQEVAKIGKRTLFSRFRWFWRLYYKIVTRWYVR